MSFLNIPQPESKPAGYHSNHHRHWLFGGGYHLPRPIYFQHNRVERTIHFLKTFPHLNSFRQGRIQGSNNGRCSRTACDVPDGQRRRGPANLREAKAETQRSYRTSELRLAHCRLAGTCFDLHSGHDSLLEHHVFELHKSTSKFPQVCLNFAIVMKTFQPEVAQVACKSACEHIAKSIKEILLDENVKQISIGALNQINLDLLQCERKFLLIKKKQNYLFH